MRSIAGQIGRAPSSISRELGRNVPRDHRARYRASTANYRAELRARRPRASKLGSSARLRAEVRRGLILTFSPEQISHRLVMDFPDDPEMRVSHETIYQGIYVQGRGGPRRELAVCLGTGRALRKPQRRADGRVERIKDKVMISGRPPRSPIGRCPGTGKVT